MSGTLLRGRGVVCVYKISVVVVFLMIVSEYLSSISEFLVIKTQLQSLKRPYGG